MPGDPDRQLPPALLIICGLPYSGKTAVSAALAGHLEGAEHIDVDQINVERGFGVACEAVPMMEWSTTYQVAYERATNALGDGRTVIFDAVNASRAQRDILRTNARKAGAEAAVVFVATSESACRERRQADPQPMDDIAFERALSRFDPPQAAERVVVYLPGMDVRDLLTGLGQVFEP